LKFDGDGFAKQMQPAELQQTKEKRNSEWKSCSGTKDQPRESQRGNTDVEADRVDQTAANIRYFLKNLHKVRSGRANSKLRAAYDYKVQF
jgi:hypothetical protein